MLLYDNESSVDWFYDGEKTKEQMQADAKYSGMFDAPAVLYDNGAEKVYSWESLEDVCARYYVRYTSPQSSFDELQKVFGSGRYLSDDVEDLQQDVVEAKEAAEEAKQIAESAGTDPAVEAFARIAIVPMAATMTDEQAISVSTLWPEWSADSVSYKVDDVVQHADHLWRCEQAHTSQESWTPDAAPSLWSQIDIAGDGVDVWTQPTGAHNAYNVGDRVHYPTASDPIYVSTIDGNVWSPDAYPQGWQLVEEG